jgi:hypothetical protein
MFCFHGECYNTVSVGQNHNTGARDEVFDYIVQSKYLEGPVKKSKLVSRRKYGKIK